MKMKSGGYIKLGIVWVFLLLTAVVCSVMTSDDDDVVAASEGVPYDEGPSFKRCRFLKELIWYRVCNEVEGSLEDENVIDLTSAIAMPLPAGVRFVAGPQGGGEFPAFDITDTAELQVPAKDILPRTFPNDFSIMVTVKPSSSKGGVLFATTSEDGLKVYLSLEILPVKDNGFCSIRFIFFNPYFEIMDTVTFDVNQFTHQWMRFALSKQNDKITLYYNCSAQQESKITQKSWGALIIPGTSRFYIAKAGNNLSHDRFNGAIAELRLHQDPNRAATQCIEEREEEEEEEDFYGSGDGTTTPSDRAVEATTDDYQTSDVIRSTREPVVTSVSSSNLLTTIDLYSEGTTSAPVKEPWSGTDPPLVAGTTPPTGDQDAAFNAKGIDGPTTSSVTSPVTPEASEPITTERATDVKTTSSVTSQSSAPIITEGATNVEATPSATSPSGAPITTERATDRPDVTSSVSSQGTKESFTDSITVVTTPSVATTPADSATTRGNVIDDDNNRLLTTASPFTAVEITDQPTRQPTLATEITEQTDVKGDKGDSFKGDTIEVEPAELKGDKGNKGERGDSGPVYTTKAEKGEKGNKGDAGVTGDAGPEGVPGISTKGEKGDQGLPGLIGDKGEKGDSASEVIRQGQKGEPGETGPPGKDGVALTSSTSLNRPPGPVGPPGHPGPPGAPGTNVTSPGPKGEKGHQGIQGEPGAVVTLSGDHVKVISQPGQQPILEGLKGDKGDEGVPGIHGVPGDNGDNGEKGEFGEKGEPGEQGVIGVPGPPGRAVEPLLGEKGQKGDQGIPGAKGESTTGLQGRTGPQGPVGPPGPPGPVVSVGAGNNNAIGNGGPSAAANVAEQGPPGPKGDKGDTGFPGKVGIPGESGVHGGKGEKGSMGVAGISVAGPKGDTGTTGEKGAHGEPGIPGTLVQGIKGEQGEKGEIGYKGESGTKGEQGVPGEKGIKGDLGLLGHKGEPGDKGKDGRPGQQAPKSEPGLTGEKGEPGWKGEPGARGAPGISVRGNPGPPGPPGLPAGPQLVSSVNGGTEQRSTQKPDNTISENLGIVTFYNDNDMAKAGNLTPEGTIAFVLDSQQLFVRHGQGWGSIEYGKNIIEVSGSKSLPTDRPKIVMPESGIAAKLPYLHLIALNEPVSGKMGGLSAIDSKCWKQARSAGLKGFYRAFLSAEDQGVKSVVRRRDRKLPVANLKGEQLFPSWHSIFNGVEAFNPETPLLSFNGNDVRKHPNWPFKIIWHGSKRNGHLQQGYNCNKWASSDRSVSSYGAPINGTGSVLEPHQFSCDNKFIVLCIKVGVRR